LRLTEADFRDISPGQYHFHRDSTNTQFTLIYPWPTGTSFHLILARDFAKDSSGRQLLKTDTISFSTKKDIDYGEVRIRIPNLDLSRNPVLQFVQSDVVKYAYPFKTQKEFRKVLFAPGDYELRILYDANKNGVWDPGEFFGKHRHPEIVQPVKGLRGGKFTVKANWDNDLDITL
jgi:hypothetical protein